MLCKVNMKKNVLWVLFALGVVSLVFGLVTYLTASTGAHNVDMVLGMFTGLGFALMAASLVRILRPKLVSAEKLEQEEIDKNDERNIAVTRAAHAVGNAVGIVLFASLTFLFVFLDYRIPAYICLGALYVQVLSFVIAYRVLGKKM